MSARRRNSGQVLNNAAGYVLLAGVVVLIALALYAPIRESRDLHRQVNEARHRLERLMVLHPLYIEISNLPRPADWPALASGLRRPLGEEDVMAIPGQFLAVATASGMELAAVSPKVQTDGQGRRHLNVEATVYGPYARLQDFLLGVMRMPSLDVLENVEVRRLPMQEQITVFARLALE